MLRRGLICVWTLPTVLLSLGCDPPKPPPPAHTGSTASSPTLAAEPSQEPDDTEPSTPTQKYVEPLFEGWEKPRVALLISGQQQGYLEPCGCTGLANQKGGLARRHTLAKQLRERGWPLVAVDAGNQVRRLGPQADLKFQYTALSLNEIGYQAVTLGINDLRLSSGDLLSATGAGDDASSPFLSANVAIFDRSLMPTHRIIEEGSVKIGVTAVLGAELQEQLSSDEIIKEPAADALRKVVPKLEAAECDVLVLLAHASAEESQQLARDFPAFDVVVTAGTLGDPPPRPEPIDGSDALYVQAGVKGMFVVVLGVYGNDAEPSIRYQRVAVDASYKDSAEMLEFLKQYQETLEDRGLEGLSVNAISHPTGNTFKGSEKCGECHTKAYAQWKATGHAKATDALVHPNERSTIPRHYDPECLSCHVTGWDAKGYFPYKSGYLSLQETPLMVANGCENCHGPGSAHVQAEEDGAPDEELVKLRASMRLLKADAEKKCVECHDLDNDPGFHDPGAFDRYWPKVEHYGRD